VPLVYARHGRELMGCKSPVFESSTVVRRGKSTSRRQGRLREEGSGGSPSAKLWADEQKQHTRPSSGQVRNPGVRVGKVRASVAV